MASLVNCCTIIFAIVLCAPAWAQTAEDCIGRFSEMKVQFEEAAIANGLVEPPAPTCVQDGHIISLDAEGPMAPDICEGGEWDHWHLEAKAVLGPSPACILMLRGLPDREGCGTEQIIMDLPASEGAGWRNFLRSECPEAG